MEEERGRERATASAMELNILLNIFMPEAARGFGHGAFSVNVQCTYGYNPHVIHVYIHTCTRARSLSRILRGREEQMRERKRERKREREREREREVCAVITREYCIVFLVYRT